MRQSKRTAADTYQARFEGARWAVAMREVDWRQFCSLPNAANDRLTVVLDHFCAHGEGDLPRSAFSWMSASASDPKDVRCGAFEARGVVIHGRRASSDARNIFFVTRITVDQPPDVQPRRRKRASDPRQGALPFNKTDKGERT